VPQVAAGRRIEGDEIPIGITGEDRATASGERAAIGTAEIRKRPFLDPGGDIDRLERARRPLDGSGT
jgi:hypothetical protein